MPEFNAFNSRFTLLEALGPVAKIVLAILMLAAAVFFFLSFTSRFGRSRWPLHALIATCLLSLSCGLISTALEIIAVGNDVSIDATQQLIYGTPGSLFWFGVIATLSALMALIRALYGLIREPGPRF